MFRFFKISGHSMQPTLKASQYVLSEGISYIFRNPKVGEVISFKYGKSGKILVKRIIGADPGGKFRVAGDNSADSLDSAIIGPVDRQDIVGQIVML